MKAAKAQSRNAKIVSISLPPDMQTEVNQVAKEERRTVSEVLREAFRQYMALRTLNDVRRQAQKSAKKRKLKPGDVGRIIEEGRR